MATTTNKPPAGDKTDADKAAAATTTEAPDASASTPSPSGDSQSGASAPPAGDTAALQQEIADLKAMVLTLADAVQAKAGQRKVSVPPLENEVGPLPASKRHLLAPYEVRITGPDSEKFVQPITVEALGESQAKARVAKAAGIVKTGNTLSAKRLGKTWTVDTKDEKDRGMDFPRTVAIDTAAHAVEVAAAVAKVDPVKLVATAKS